MRFVARLFLLSILAISCQSFGAEPKELKYAPAVRELREYDAAVQALKKKQQRFLNLAAAKHERELADLREQATEALKKIQDEVTKEGRLDDALAIRAAIKKLDEPQNADDASKDEPTESKPDDNPFAIPAELVGTRWINGPMNVPFLIGKDFVQFPGGKPKAWFIDGKVCFYHGDKWQVFDTTEKTVKHYRHEFTIESRGPLE